LQLGDNAVITTIANSGVVEVVGNAVVSNVTGSGSLVIDDGGVLTATGTLPSNITDNGTLQISRSGLSTFAGVISGTGNFVKAGTGSLTLTQPQTYGGSTTVGSGTLVYPIGYGAVNLLPDGALYLNGGSLDMRLRTDTVGPVTINGGTVTNGTLISTGAFNLESGQVLASIRGVDLNGGLSGNGGETVLYGNNTFTGNITLDSGTVTLRSAGALGSTGSITLNADATLSDCVQITDYSARLSASSAGTFDYNVDTSNGDVTIDRVPNFPGTGIHSTLTKVGSGTLTITDEYGVNFELSDITVNEGTVAMNASPENWQLNKINFHISFSSANSRVPALVVPGYIWVGGEHPRPPE
jgi:autotransporter-associated beta strand protein